MARDREGRLIVELKAVEGFAAIHKAQVLSYLKATQLRLALLINFNVPILTKGLKRMVNHYIESPVADSVSASSAHQPEEEMTLNSLSTLRFPPRLSVSAVKKDAVRTEPL